MMKVIIILFISAVTRAQDIVASRTVSLFSTHLERLCEEMGSDYLEQIRNLHKLKERLQSGGEDLKADVHKIAERLNRLTKPEWNREIYEIELRWFLPFVGKTDAVELENAFFMDELNEDVKNDFYFPFQPLNRQLMLVYRKKATALELCQMLPTLEFDVSVRFRKKILGDYQSVTTQKFRLFSERRENEN